jgi:FkbM family methyltransferase
MRKIFIDGGGNNGSSVRMFRSKFPKAEEFEIFTFEANPNFNDCYKNLNVNYKNAAIWTYDGEIEFYLGKNPKNMSASVFKHKTSGNLRKTPIKVKCIDLGKWIMSKFTPQDYIVLKLDIEGAEYNVLPKMIEDKSIAYIDELFMDWHYTKVAIEESKHLLLISQLAGFGLTSKKWATESDEIEGIA